MDVLILARVSSDASGTARSVEEQVAALRAWAEREDWNVVHVITEVGSASRYSTRADRTEWREAITWLRSGTVRALLTWEMSRATRELDVYTTLRKECAANNVLWGYGGQLYDLAKREGRFRTGIDALLSEQEVDRTSERVKRAATADARAGKPNGRLVWGYRRVYDPATKALLHVEPDPAKAAIVGEAATRFLDGESLRSIAISFNDRGIAGRSPEGRDPQRRRPAWTSHDIRAMLGKPAYAGFRSHFGELSDAIWPAIIPRSDWKKIQERLQDNKPPAALPFVARSLLGGLALCGAPGCGASLVAAQNNARSRGQVWRAEVTYPTYACPLGWHVSIKQEHADTIVLEYVRARASRADALGLVADLAGPVALRRREIINAIRSDEEWLMQVRERAEQTDQIALYYAQQDIISPQLRAARNELAALDAQNPQLAALANSADPVDRWMQLPREDLRTILRNLLTITVVRAPQPGRRGIAAALDRVRIEWKVN
jgi:site-specific DNA recombinase